MQRPGDILALVTQRSLGKLSETVDRASENQLAQLSSVEEIAPYEPPIEKGENRSVVTFFDGTLDDGTSLRQRGMQEFNRLGLQLDPYGKAGSTYTSSSLPPNEDLRSMPWLRRVRPILRLRSLARFGTRPIRPQNVILPDRPLPTPIVGVIDSGIDQSVPWLKHLTVAQDTHIPPQYSDFNHGSLVGSLAATGGGFNSDPNYSPLPVARLLDIQVLGTDIYEEIDETDLVTQVEDAVERYGPHSAHRPQAVDQPVVVWNLSLGGASVAPTQDFSQVAVELDRIAQENGVVFTIASGNYEDLPLRRWTPSVGPDNIDNDEDRITPPADSALGVSVGSLSDTSNPPSAAPAEYPSPFSRRGPGPGMLVKPDVVHYGGTCGQYGERVGGVLGPYRNGAPLESIGTSFAAPRVAAQLAQLVEVLPDPEPDLLKLLLLLSCVRRGDCNVNTRESVNYYGFGIPDQPTAILSCNVWECTILLRGELRPGRKLQAPIPFPPSLDSAGLRRGFVRMALVYTPILDASKGSEYCQTNVTASLGRQFDYPIGSPRRYRREILPVPQNPRAGAQNEGDLIEHGWKWSPIKVYERAFHRMRVDPKELGWRLSVELLLRRELEPHRDTVRQPFWLGIKIVDPERRGQVYQEISQQIQATTALAQPISLRAPIRV